MVGLFKNSFESSRPIEALEISEVVDRIKEDQDLVREVGYIMNASTLKEIKARKQLLPTVSWQGVIVDSVIQLSGYQCFEVSSIRQDSELIRIKDALMGVPWVYAFYNLPDLCGVYIIVKVPITGEKTYQNCYKQVGLSLWKDYGIYTNFYRQSDIKQTFLMSHDSDMYVNPECLEFPFHFNHALEMEESPKEWTIANLWFIGDKIRQERARELEGIKLESSQAIKLMEKYDSLKEFYDRLVNEKPVEEDLDIVVFMSQRWENLEEGETDLSKKIWRRAFELSQAGIPMNTALLSLVTLYQSIYDKSRIKWCTEKAYEVGRSSFGRTRADYLKQLYKQK